MIHQKERKSLFFLICHCWWLACIVSFTCIKPFSLLLSFLVNALHIFYFFHVFLLHLFLVIFFLVVCQEQRFCSIFMKSYAGNWQINHNSRNRMSKKILSERIPLDGQWNNRTSPTWPETRHGREGRSRTSFFFLTKLTKSNDGAIPDNRSWNPRGFIGPAVIYRTCPMVFRFHWYMLKPVEA